jgi:chaperonin GroEL
MRGGLKVAAVKAPGFGDRRKSMLEDMSVLTSGQLLSEDLGVKMDALSGADVAGILGNAKRVVVTKDHTTIVDGAGQKKDIDLRCAQIRMQISDSTSDYDREKLQERLGKLKGGVAVISVGANTEVEVKEIKDRVDDALSATRAAVEEGIVAGGGTALLYARRALDKASSLQNLKADEGFGVKVVYNALQAPVQQISHNAGDEGSVIVHHIDESQDKNYGYNARDGKYENMLEGGIVDPTKVVRLALENASSIARLSITMESMIVEKKEQGAKAPAAPGGGLDMMGGMGM